MNAIPKASSRHFDVWPLLFVIPIALFMAIMTPAFQNGHFEFSLIPKANAEPAKVEEALKTAVPSLLPKNEQPPLYRLLNDSRVILNGAQRQDVEDKLLDPQIAKLVVGLLDEFTPQRLQSIQVAMVQTGHCVHVDCDDETSNISDHSDGHAVDIYGINGSWNANADNPMSCPVAEWLYSQRSHFSRLQVISPCTSFEDGKVFFSNYAHRDHVHVGGRS